MNDGTAIGRTHLPSRFFCWDSTTSPATIAVVHLMHLLFFVDIFSIARISKKASRGFIGIGHQYKSGFIGIGGQHKSGFIGFSCQKAVCGG